MNNLFGQKRSLAVRILALRGVALFAMCSAIIAPDIAHAQQTQAGVEQVTVTGTLIRSPNLTSDSPVATVSQVEIAQTNVQTTEGLLNQMPAITVGTTQQANPFTNSGAINVNLRNLGPTRTLALIDGKRIGPADPTSATGFASDLSFIPLDLVTSVDVLTGGASAVYGSDAIAGVVNFHLNRNFEGVELNYSFSGYAHENSNGEARSLLASSQMPVPNVPKNVFDGIVNHFSGLVGVNSANSKGNVTLYADYQVTQPILGSQRDYQACPLTVTVVSQKNVIGCTGGVPFAAVFPALSGLYELAADGTLVPNNPANWYNNQASTYLQRKDARADIGALAHYQFNEHADVYADVMYMNDATHMQSALTGFSRGGSKVTIPCSILSQTPGQGVAPYQAVGCTSQAAMVTITNPGFSHLPAIGPRLIDTIHNDYRILAGVRGDIDGNWAYDVSASHWQDKLTQTWTNFGTTPLTFTNAVTTGTFNIFAPTPASEAFFKGPFQAVGGTLEDDIQVNLTGSLGPYGVKSPLAKNAVAVAVGAEYRHVGLTYTPDAGLQGGLTSTGARPPVAGGESSQEFYGELRVPLIEDLFLAKAVNLDLAFRNSNYSVNNTTATFVADTYRINIDYAPIDDVRFRGGYNRAARAPNAAELFALSATNFQGGLIDPCGAGGTASLAACTNAAIGRAAVTPAQYLTIPIIAGNSLLVTTGGNTHLKAEKADTWTVGFNLTPSFLPGFNGSVDYWDIKVNGYIGTLSPAQLISSCYSGAIIYCQYIQRDPSTGSLGFGGGSITATSINLNKLHNRGIDFDEDYHANLGDLVSALDDYGAIDVHFLGTYALDAITQSATTTKPYDCVGEFGAACGGPLSTWRHTMRVAWVTPWKIDVALTWRRLGSVTYDGNDPTGVEYLATNNLYNGPDARIPSYDYIDLQAGYTLSDRYTFRIGVNNLFDKDPPIVSVTANAYTPTANGNTYTQYDSLGRLLYVSFKANL